MGLRRALLAPRREDRQTDADRHGTYALPGRVMKHNVYRPNSNSGLQPMKAEPTSL